MRSIFVYLGMCLLICSCKQTVMTYKQTDSFLARLDKKTEFLKDKIEVEDEMVIQAGKRKFAKTHLI